MIKRTKQRYDTRHQTRIVSYATARISIVYIDSLVKIFIKLTCMQDLFAFSLLDLLGALQVTNMQYCQICHCKLTLLPIYVYRNIANSRSIYLSQSLFVLSWHASYIHNWSISQNSHPRHSVRWQQILIKFKLVLAPEAVVTR